MSSKRGFERKTRVGLVFPALGEANCPHIEFAPLEQSRHSGTLLARYPSYPLPSASAIRAPMSRFVTTVGRPQPRVTEAHVRSDNVRCVSLSPFVTIALSGRWGAAAHTTNVRVHSTINITTANGSSITITGSHIELEVQNLSPPTNNNDERRLSASRPNGAEVIDDVREDAQTTVDWSADANLARQIEADRVSTLFVPNANLLRYRALRAKSHFCLLVGLTAKDARTSWAARGWTDLSRWDTCPRYTKFDRFSNAHCER